MFVVAVGEERVHGADEIYQLVGPFRTKSEAQKYAEGIRRAIAMNSRAQRRLAATAWVRRLIRPRGRRR